jgi:hypothetical protein
MQTLGLAQIKTFFAWFKSAQEIISTIQALSLATLSKILP